MRSTGAVAETTAAFTSGWTKLRPSPASTPARASVSSVARAVAGSTFGERRDVLDQPALADDGGRLRERLGLGAERPQPPLDGRGDAVGAELRDPLAVGRGAGEAELAGLAREHRHEQRVAAGGLERGVAEVGVGDRAEDGQQQVGDVVSGERRRPQDARVRAGGELLQQLLRRARLVRALAGDHRDREPVEAAAEVLEEAQRRHVGPLHVVDEQHQRLRLGEVGDEPVEPVQDRVAGLVGALAGAGREHQLRTRGGAAQQLRAPLGRRLREQQLEQLQRDAEAEGAVELAGAGVEDERGWRRRTRPLGDRRQQRRLADPGRPLDQRQRSVPRRCLGERAIERLQLSVPCDQRPCHPQRA